MRSLVKLTQGFGNMAVIESPKPVIKQNEVLVKVHSVGVCGTDIKIYENKFSCETPIIVGHEFSGEIVECSENVTEFTIGQRVVAEQHFNACGICSFCLAGKRHWCEKKRSPGYMSNGAFAEYIAVDQSLLHEMPKKMTYDQAALIEPMGIAAYATLESARIFPEETVVILGCGPIALLAIQMARIAGASKVFVTGLDADEKKRFAFAEQYGADDAINVQRQDSVETILAMTDGCGADVVIDMTGAQSAVLDGLKMLKRGGRFVAVGMQDHSVQIPWSDTVIRSVSIIFSFSADHSSWRRCLSMIERGAVDLQDFTKNIYSLNEWQDAFEKVRSGEILKAIIRI